MATPPPRRGNLARRFSVTTVMSDVCNQLLDSVWLCHRGGVEELPFMFNDGALGRLTAHCGLGSGR